MNRGGAIMALCGALLGACNDGIVDGGMDPSVPPSPTASAPTAAPSETMTPATCGAVEHPAEQGGSHLVGDAAPPVPYSSTPGTSGWHAGGAPPLGVFGEVDALTEPQLVLALEVGQVVAAYDPEAFPAASLRQLEELARTDHAGRLTVTPFDGDMGAPLVLNAWVTRQPCSDLDEAALAAFVEAHAAAASEHP